MVDHCQRARGLKLTFKHHNVVPRVAWVVEGLGAADRFDISEISDEEGGTKDEGKRAVDHLFSEAEEDVSELILVLHHFKHRSLILCLVVLAHPAREVGLIFGLHVVGVEANEELVQVEP